LVDIKKLLKDFKIWIIGRGVRSLPESAFNLKVTIEENIKSRKNKLLAEA